MVISELKRYLKSKYNIISCIICFMLVLFSYHFTNLDKKELYNCIMNPMEDFNLEIGRACYEGINGFTYLFDFLFSSDLYIIFVIILSLTIGVVVGGVELKNRTTGFGNMMFSRIGLQKGNCKILLAQLIYVLIYVTLFFTVLVVLTLAIFPVKQNGVNFYLVLFLDTASTVRCIALIVEHISKLLVYLLLVTIITYGVSYFINNKYAISCVPLLIYIVPLFSCSIIGNVIEPVGKFISHFVADSYLLSIYNRFAAQHVDIGDEICLPILLLILAITVYSAYIKRVKRNYL